MGLVPQIFDAVSVPVIVQVVIMDERRIVAALLLGDEGLVCHLTNSTDDFDRPGTSRCSAAKGDDLKKQILRTCDGLAQMLAEPDPSRGLWGAPCSMSLEALHPCALKPARRSRNAAADYKSQQCRQCPDDKEPAPADRRNHREAHARRHEDTDGPCQRAGT